MDTAEALQKVIKDKLKAIKLAHLGLTSGCIIALLIFLDANKGLNYVVPTDVLTLASVLLTAVVVPVSFYISKNKINRIPESIPLPEKLTLYQSAFIIKCAAIEASTLFALVVFYINQNIFNLLISVALIVFLFIQKTNKEKIATHLNLKKEEKKMLVR